MLLQMHHLKGLAILGRFSIIFHKGGNFRDFLFVFIKLPLCKLMGGDMVKLYY